MGPTSPITPKHQSPRDPTAIMKQQMQPKQQLGKKAATMHEETMQPRKATLANKAATMYDARNATTNSNTRQ